jgi:organic radical activating enzyme
MIGKTDKIIKLVEVADTWQGEGPCTGRQMLIARFKYCNRHCQYCDTWIKMKTSTEGSYSIDDLNNALAKTRGLMITGGEPTYENKSANIHNLSCTLNMIEHCDYQVANIETNGYDLAGLLTNITFPKNKVVKIMYSPKIFSEYDYTIELKNLELAMSDPMVYLKIVADRTALTEKFIKQIATNNTDRSKVYLMPLGVTSEEIAKNFEYCINLADECNMNISTRMHIVHTFT